MKKHPKLDTFILLLALFLISGGMLAYNIRTVESGELTVSLHDLIYDSKEDHSAISPHAEANLISHESVFTGTSPNELPEDTSASVLLPPIITPPAE